MATTSHSKWPRSRCHSGCSEILSLIAGLRAPAPAGPAEQARMRKTTTTEVRLDERNLRIHALQAEVPGHFACQGADCARICFAPAPWGTQNHTQWAGQLGKIGKTSRPCAVVVSRASVRLRNPMHLIRRFSMVSIICFIERASRSSCHTISVSPLRANSRASYNAGL